MTYIDTIRNMSDVDLTALLNQFGAIGKVVAHITDGHANEPVRQHISDRVKSGKTGWEYQANLNRYRYTIDDVSNAFATAGCWSDIYRSLGITTCNHNKDAVIKLAGIHGVNVPTFSEDDLKTAYRRGKTNWVAADIFIENSTYCRSSVRSACIRHKILPEYKCSKCAHPPMWDGAELTLELDHINGVSTDNRPENLRWLCPNCHSQTHTFKGKNRPPKIDVIGPP